MAIQDILARVHKLQQQLHEAIVEEFRNQRSNTMKQSNSGINGMVAMVTASIHVCDKCASEHHGPRPVECSFCKKSMSFTSVSSLADASARVKEILAVPDHEVEDGTEQQITIVGPAKAFVPRTVLRKAASKKAASKHDSTKGLCHRMVIAA
jgi:hypothetical protein